MNDLKELLTTKLSYVISALFIWFLEDPFKAIGAIGGLIILGLTIYNKHLDSKLKRYEIRRNKRADEKADTE